MPPSSINSSPSRPHTFDTCFDVQGLADAIFGTEDGGKHDFAKARDMTHQILQLAEEGQTNSSAMDLFDQWRAEFCGRFLHRYICFLLPLLPRLDLTSFPLQLASMLFGSNNFTRWVRTAPSVKVELLFVRLVESWMRTCPDLTRMFEAEVEGEMLNSSVSYVQQLSLLILHFPFDVDLRTSTAFSSSEVVPSLLTDLQTLSRNCSHLLASRSTPATVKTGIRTLMEAPQLGMEVVVFYLSHPEKSALEVREHFHSMSWKWRIVWWVCSATLSGERASCSTPDGEEMMACGRCQTVRYCSKDHQRAHWKEHKSRCFPIEWDFS